jgi:hemolysin III
MNCLTHGVGVVLSVAGLVALITAAALNGTARHVVTVTLFGVALLLVYVASTAYHLCRPGRLRERLKVFDHAAIYCLIAGTYTPFLLVLVRGQWGWTLFGVLWGLAAVGIAFKLFYTGRFDLISTLVYIAMGWSGLIAAGPLLDKLPGGAVAWIVAGGIAYTGGAAFYLWDRLPYNHAVWHVFVLIGSLCHFLAVYRYVLPA